MNVDPIVLKKELWYLILYLTASIPLLVLYLWLSKKARKEWLVLMGELKPRIKPAWDKRQYVRLDSVFPIAFQKIDGEKLGPLHEGFTDDVSRMGMKIKTKVLHGRRLESFVPDHTRIKLTIELPIYTKPIETTATVKWIQKIEGARFDKYTIGISYSDIKEEDASRILKYALWLHRKPVFVAAAIAFLVLIVAISITFIVDLRSSKQELQQEAEAAGQVKKRLVSRMKASELEKTRLRAELEEAIEREARGPKIDEEKAAKEEKRFLEMEAELGTILEEKVALQERLEQLEEEAVFEETVEEEPAGEEELEEEAEPEEEAAPKITDKMIKDEAVAYKTFRDYILKEEIQLLDRYCYQHKSSIYHAAGLFALAELRYKHKSDWLTVENTYKEAIKDYPRSKYASYASHRIEQVKKRQSYDTYTLRYFYVMYGLPPLLDYREIEPYKE